MCGGVGVHRFVFSSLIESQDRDVIQVIHDDQPLGVFNRSYCRSQKLMSFLT